MKFAKLVVTAFVASSNPENRAACSSRSNSLNLVPPPVSHYDLSVAEPAIVGRSQLLGDRQQVESPVLDGIREWLIPSALAAEPASPPTQEEVKLLREAFATFYGLDRDLEKSEKLLSNVIEAWQQQPPGTFHRHPNLQNMILGRSRK